MTGHGSLRFRQADGSIVAINGVLYSKAVHATLISLASIRRVKGIFVYDVGRDSFEIYAADSSHLFSCPLDIKHRRWYIPLPAIKTTLDMTDRKSVV